MPCCLLCFDDKPDENDPKGNLPETWGISMVDALSKNPKGCCLGCWCPCCFAYHLRQKSLEMLGNGMKDYKCCQGYLGGCPCCKPGAMGEQSSPECCLCCEVTCCLGLAVSGTRSYVADHYQLRSDPCDNRLIQFNNCLQALACICDILAIFNESYRDLAQVIRLIADLVFWMLQACMQGQIHYELTEGHGKDGYSNPNAPLTYGTYHNGAPNVYDNRGSGNGGYQEPKNQYIDDRQV